LKWRRLVGADECEFNYPLWASLSGDDFLFVHYYVRQKFTIFTGVVVAVLVTDLVW
jgi:hypothetical protein